MNDRKKLDPTSVKLEEQGRLKGGSYVGKSIILKRHVKEIGNDFRTSSILSAYNCQVPVKITHRVPANLCRTGMLELHQMPPVEQKVILCSRLKSCSAHVNFTNNANRVRLSDHVQHCFNSLMVSGFSRSPIGPLKKIVFACIIIGVQSATVSGPIAMTVLSGRNC